MTEPSISDLFEGSTVNTIKCLECETQSHTSERFCDLSLSVPKDGYTTLENSLEQLTSIERLNFVIVVIPALYFDY